MIRLFLILLLLAMPWLALADCPTVRMPADHVCLDNDMTAQDYFDEGTCSNLVMTDDNSNSSTTAAITNLVIVPQDSDDWTENYDPLGAWAAGTADVDEWCWTSPDGSSHKFFLDATIDMRANNSTLTFLYWGVKNGTGVANGDQIGMRIDFTSTQVAHYFTPRVAAFTTLNDGDCVGLLVGSAASQTKAIYYHNIRITQLDCRDDGT